jgi:acetoin utilization deacetylase AcuC-like enzyme
MMQMMYIWTLLLSTSSLVSGRPLIITSQKFATSHVPRGYHPENPERVAVVLEHLQKFHPEKYEIKEPSAETSTERQRLALEAIQGVHDEEYIKEVKMRSQGGARQLSPWDSDTYLSRDTFETCLLAQSAWLDGVDHVLGGGNEFAFAITRPPGHHAERKTGMGFCLFNFAAAAAVYALNIHKAQKVAILDIDVHFGNGVSDIASAFPNIRYASLHQAGIFPLPPTIDGVQPTPHQNILTVNLNSGFRGEAFLEALRTHALPFLQEFGADLLIVCAGFDALSSDDLAAGALRPRDYAAVSELLKASSFNRVLFGLEGGYNLSELPLAVEAAIEPFASV